MNKVILVGNLAGDPDVSQTRSGISRCTFRLAVQRPYINSNGTRDADFLTIVAWRNTADFCGKYLGKGRKIALEGRIETRDYTDDDGVKHYITEIVAENIEPCGSNGRRTDDAE